MERQVGSLQSDILAQRFRELDNLLFSNRCWWQFKPFHYREYYWQQSHPDLCAALERLGDARVEELERDTVASAAWLAPWIPDASHLLQLARVPRFKARHLGGKGRLSYGVPGRKWEQIRAFGGCLAPTREPLVEWCAGKGHLGRLLAVCDRRPVVALELQEQLCSAGEQLAARSGADMRFIPCDVFAPAAGAWIGPGTEAVALHACGDLHLELMRQWVRNRGGKLSLSPCCYHLTRSESFAPASSTAAAGKLRLTKADLHLPLQETVTAGAGVRRLRRTELLWRLAFDELQRELRGEDSYLPLPHAKKSLFSTRFDTFARWAAERKGLVLPGKLDEEKWVKRGHRRLRCVQRMEMVTHLFRRPLELWLVLDRALFLCEQGAEVEIGEFCDRQLTPRNIMLRAWY